MPSVAVFIDYQNVYKRSREAFFYGKSIAHYEGQISPRKVGDEIVAKSNQHNPGHSLAFVHVYRGMPDGGRDPKGYAACSRQVAAWGTQQLVQVTTRPLRYPWNYPTEKPSEKGIDVQLAIDFVLAAMGKQFDVGVIFSGDTDLRPALEAVIRLKTAQVQVAAWKPTTGGVRRISVPNVQIWCHQLDQVEYSRMADATDYNQLHVSPAVAGAPSVLAPGPSNAPSTSTVAKK